MVRTIRRSYVGAFAVLAAIVLLCVVATSSGAAVWDTTRVSVDSSGAEGNETSGGWGRDADISDDGRFVAFRSYATNLVDGDTNNTNNIFVYDRQDGTTDLVSINSTWRVAPLLGPTSQRG